MDNIKSSKIMPKTVCTPAQIYIIFSIILLIITSIKLKPSIVSVMIHVAYIVFWTVLLNTLCSYGYSGVSWFLLFFPFIIVAIVIFVFIAINISKLIHK